MTVTCVCGTSFEAKRSTAKYCSAACRQRARRGAVPVGPSAGQPPATPDDAQTPSLTAAVLIGEDIVAATKRDLEAADKLDSVVGRQAMLVAARMTLTRGTGSEIAALSRELSRLMAQAIGRGAEEADPVDEVKRKRDEKIAKARQATS